MRKIALVGTSSSADKAPYDDDTWEIWGVSARGDYVTRANRWFELHRLEGEPEDWANLWRKTIRTFSHDVELMMFYPEKNLGPKVSVYPSERISERFGTYFMTSSFAWMMALAIDEMCPLGGKWKPGEIGIWGVEMEYATEYRHQRSGFRHFIDLARVMGIKVTLLASGGLAYEPVPYPMWQDDPLINKIEFRNEQTRKKLMEYENSLRLTRSMIAQNRAVLDELDRMGKEKYDSAARRVALEKETLALMDSSAQLSRDITEAEGANEEQRWLKDYLSP